VTGVATLGALESTAWNFSNTFVLWQSSQAAARDAARIAEYRRGNRSSCSHVSSS
jgi:hypothetical protein